MAERRHSLQKLCRDIDNFGSIQQIAVAIIKEQSGLSGLTGAWVIGENLQVGLFRISIGCGKEALQILFVAVEATDSIAVGQVLFDADPVGQLSWFAVQAQIVQAQVMQQRQLVCALGMPCKIVVAQSGAAILQILWNQPQTVLDAVVAEIQEEGEAGDGDKA